jgi:hypothetical protein
MLGRPTQLGVKLWIDGGPDEDSFIESHSTRYGSSEDKRLP